MASYQVQPPEPFNFSTPSEWPKWIRRFERFRTAAELTAKGEDIQVNTLMYSMGGQADDILHSFGLSEEDQKNYTVVKDRFERHFVKRRNVIYERAKFNSRKQQEGEPVDTFITDLYSLAEHCSFGDLRDELIRDHIVVGLRSAALSEKLQLDPDLTLESALTDRQKPLNSSRGSLEVMVQIKRTSQLVFLRGSPTNVLASPKIKYSLLVLLLQLPALGVALHLPMIGLSVQLRM